MMKFSHNLPDVFVERVRTLEVKLENAIEEIAELKSLIKQHRSDTKRLRQVVELFAWMPGGAKSFLVGIGLIVFINSLAVEVFLKSTNFHIQMRKYMIEFLEVK